MNIAFVGLSGVPYSNRACDTRLLAFVKTFEEGNNSVFIFNRFSNLNQKNQTIKNEFNTLKIFEIFNRKIPENIIGVIFYYLLSYPLEAIRLIKFNNTNGIDILHIYSGHFIEFIHYYIIAKIIGAKTIYQYVEFRSAIKRKSLYHIINGFLCDNFGIFFFNGIISISNFIEKHIKSISKNKPTIKIPPLCNFDYFDSIEKKNLKSKYLLYCGSIEYIDIIYDIITSYKLSNCKQNEIKLLLIVNGESTKMQSLMNYVANSQDIIIKSGLEYSTLISYYKNSFASLIPLRDSIQDIARFPNKICEYLASSNIILTTNIGEVPQYFSDKNNALISDNYSTKNLTDQINWLISNPSKLDLIRENAYKLGQDKFDIKNYVEILNNFCREISPKS